MDTKTLFENIIKIRNYQIAKTINYSNSMKWITVFETGKNDIIVGLCESGHWVIYQNNEILILDSERSFLRAVILLEINKNIINVAIENYFQAVNIEVCANKIFPFLNIIKAGLEFETEYWKWLALKWFEELDLDAKNQIKDSLVNIVQQKSLTQKIRHRAMKELAKLNY